ILCGATTNTPALGAAQQTLAQLGVDSAGAALSCALTYPLGVVGVIFAILLLRRRFVRPGDLAGPDAEHRKNVFIASYRLTNPAVFGKSVAEVAAESHHHFVISRLWREGHVSIPTSDKRLAENDVLMVITTPHEADALRLIFGEQEAKDWNAENIDWNKIDSQLISQRILVTRSEINGKRLASLRLRNHYGINISRVYRSGVQLLATPDLVLQLGDRLTVVGEAADIRRVEQILGNAVKSLNEPNLVSVFIGIILGLMVGYIPLSIPGISIPVRLGLAGGPILVGILIGTFGPRLHMITYTTQSANMMLRALGLDLYLACLGLESGAHFFETIVRPEGALWLGLGVLLTFVPLVLVGWGALRLLRLDFGSICGLLCGSMANPMALNYANDTIEGDNPSVAYATVYPLCMFLRVVVIQVLLILLL
ncbi:MAG: putative transporter, partial [Alistipes sp.]|nr:putative transporter [Alistipes sp.]